MTLRAWIRRHPKWCSALALAALLRGMALPALLAHGADPDDASYAFESTLGPGHDLALESPKADEQQPLHCVLCHWQRAIGGASSAQYVSAAHVTAASAAPRIGDARSTDASTSATPSRGPPAFSTL